jgi:hypothetical protein
MRDNTGGTITDDALRGVVEIADFIGESQRRTFYLCERGLIPVGKLGSRWIASKTKLRAHYDKITSGGAT